MDDPEDNLNTQIRGDHMKRAALATVAALALSMSVAGTAQATPIHKSACISFFGIPICSGGSTGSNNNIGRNCAATSTGGTVYGCKTP